MSADRQIKELLTPVDQTILRALAFEKTRFLCGQRRVKKQVTESRQSAIYVSSVA